jgi:hypothetical protein
MQITRREVIASLTIIALMIVIGLVIGEAIQQSVLEKYQVYDTAVRIDAEELFRYGMETSIGHAFVYGEIKTLDPVTYPELNGNYSYIQKEEQEYTRHSRTVVKTYKDAKGNTHTKTETEYYWTWDTVRTEEKTATKISFLNVEFEYSQISFLDTYEIATVKTGYHKRNVYYGKDTECEGTLFAILENDNISQTSFYENLTISDTVEHLESGYELVIFWIIWIILTAGLVVGFYYLDNRWLH